MERNIVTSIELLRAIILTTLFGLRFFGFSKKKLCLLGNNLDRGRHAPKNMAANSKGAIQIFAKSKY